MSRTDDALYELLPAHFRRRDFEMGGPARALLEIFVREGAHVVDTDLDDYQDALFVETCAEIYLQRIGALVGAPTLRPLPPDAGVSMRALIGNLIRYRRAKGTVAALEMVARDATGYSVKAVEYFQRLSVIQTVHAPRPAQPATASIRDPDGRARHGGAFDTNPRTPDVRSIARAHGRYNVPNVGLHIWRLDSTPYAGPTEKPYSPENLATVPPALRWQGHDGHFAILPDGRDLPLFQSAHNDDNVSPREEDVPARLRRLPLWRELEDWRAAIARGTEAGYPRRWFAPGREPFKLYLRRVGEAEFADVPAAQLIIGNLSPDAGGGVPPWDRPPRLRDYPGPDGAAVKLPVAAVVDPATGHLVVSETEPGEPDVEEVRIAHSVGHPGPLGGGAYDRNDLHSPFEVPDDFLVYLVGPGTTPDGTRRFDDLAAALTAWAAQTTDRRGYIVVTENFVDQTEPDLKVEMPANRELTIVAAEWRTPAVGTHGTRGFIIRRSRRLMLLRRLDVAPSAAGGGGSVLTLDGVYAEAGVSVQPEALAALHIRHSTLRPTDNAALDLHGDPDNPLAVSLYRTASGPIAADDHVGQLQVSESILSAEPPTVGLQALSAAVELSGVTAFGVVEAKTLDAQNSILMGATTVQRRQHGCIRYCYLDESTAQLPRRYRCQPELAQQNRSEQLSRPLTPAEVKAVALRVQPVFVDTEPDAPGYAQLDLDAPHEIVFGGEHETEMGAWGFLGGSTRLANLADLVLDYLPFGMEAGVFRADQSSVEAKRSNVP